MRVGRSAHACVFMCVQAHTHTHMCGGQLSTSNAFLYCSPPIFFFWDRDTNWTWNSVLVRVAGKWALGFTCLCLSELGQYTCCHAWLLCGCWDLNLYPDPSPSSTLSTRPSPQPACFLRQGVIIHRAQASLDYIISSSTAWTMEWNFILKKEVFN